MPRQRRPTEFTRTDGQFTVVAEERTDRPGYLVRAWRAGNSPARESHRTAEAAVEAAERIWHAYSLGIIDRPQEHAPLTIRDLVTRVIRRDDLSIKTQRSYERVADLLIASVGEDRPPNSVRPRDVRVWLAGLTCNDTSKRTYLRTLRAIARTAVKSGMIRQDFTDGIESPPVPQHAIRPWLPTHEWDTFLAHCQPSHRIRATFMLETGLRADELAHAQEHWIHSVVGRPAIRVAPDDGFTPKWGQARSIPLSLRAQEALAEARATWTGPYIFSGQDRLRALGNLRRETHTACIRAGVTVTDTHGLRRAAGARWLEDGLSLIEVSRLLGHRDPATTARHYAGIADRHMAALMDRIDLAAESRRSNPVIGIGKRRGQ